MRDKIGFCIIALALLFAANVNAADDALHEVNAARAERGLPPYINDPVLAASAKAAAEYRAKYRRPGHLHVFIGGVEYNDFSFLPAGYQWYGPDDWSMIDSGCEHPDYPPRDWAACCTHDTEYTHAGAAFAYDANGRRYNHIFARPPRPTTPVSKASTSGVPFRPAALAPQGRGAGDSACADGQCFAPSQRRRRR